MNQEKNAIEAFSRYIDTHPNTWAGRNDKAWLQFRIGDIDGAIQTLEPVVKNDPNNIWVQNTYCALMINKRDFVNAKKACDNAKRIADVMTEEMWGTAYPGNDPRVYGDGLQAIKKSLQENIKLITNNSQSIVNKP
jgi:predicted Zn-dependent protease